MSLLRRLRHAPLPLGRLLLLALVARLLVLTGYILLDGRGLVPLAGATFNAAGTDGYLQLARTLLDHGDYGFGPELPAHHRPPLTALLMTLAAWDAQTWWLWWFALTTALGVLGVWVGARLAAVLELSVLGRNALLLALALHPYLVLPARTTTFLPVGVLAVLLLLWAVAAWQRAPSVRAAVAVGAALSAALLTHAALGVLALAAALALGWGRRGGAASARREAPPPAAPGGRLPAAGAAGAAPPPHPVLPLRHAALALFTAAALVAPWSARNWLTFHRPIAIATGAGYQYWKGHESAFAERDAGERAYLAHTGRPLRVVHWGTATPDDEALLAQLGWQHLLDTPQRLPARLAIGAAMFWAPWEAGWTKSAICALLNLPLLLLAGWLLRRRPPRDATDRCALATVLLLWAAFAFFAANTTYFPLALPPLLLLICRRLD